MKFAAVTLASVALLAEAASAMSLRGSAFVPSVAPFKADTAMMGSMQNAPNQAGKIPGIPVGTAKQRKQAIIRIEKQHKEEVAANKARKAALAEQRAKREADGLAKAMAAAESK